MYAAPPVFAREIPSQVEMLVLLRRVASGLNSSQQNELYRVHSANIGVGTHKKARPNPQVERDTWRLLASLEHLSAQTRARLGENVLAGIKRYPSDRALLWSLCRLGSRIPVYGPPNCVVPAESAAEWMETLLGLREFTSECAFTVIQLGAVTGDRVRDLDEELRSKAHKRVLSAGVTAESSARLEQFALPSKLEIERLLGESLPHGLNLVTSANCLLSITALAAELPPA